MIFLSRATSHPAPEVSLTFEFSDEEDQRPDLFQIEESSCGSDKNLEISSIEQTDNTRADDSLVLEMRQSDKLAKVAFKILWSRLAKLVYHSKVKGFYALVDLYIM
jgi:hypothetical protein